MKYKNKIVDGKKVEFSADWINGLESEMHYKWYYNQANLIYSHCHRDQVIFEIGPGTSLLRDVLVRRGWNFKSIDIDEEKNPDFVASADEFDYESHEVDVVVAFEIFEHIPFETLEKVIAKICSSVDTIIFSVPWNQRTVCSFELKLPRLKKFSHSFKRYNNKIDCLTHFWELSKFDKKIKSGRLVSLEKLEKVFNRNGFQLCLERRVDYIQYFRAIKDS